MKVNFWCRKMKRFKFSCLSELCLFLAHFCLILSLISACKYVACVASVSARARRESWDESKKGITRLETLAAGFSVWQYWITTKIYPSHDNRPSTKNPRPLDQKLDWYQFRFRHVSLSYLFFFYTGDVLSFDIMTLNTCLVLPTKK